MATKAKRPSPALGSSEEKKQKAVIEWARWIPVPPAPDIEHRAKVSDYLFAIPNGGSRHGAEAKNLKATGVKAGVWDLMLPLARQGFAGLWVEMKHGRNTLTEDQKAWGARMRLSGYKTATAWTAHEAEQAIADYLGIRII